MKFNFKRFIKFGTVVIVAVSAALSEITSQKKEEKINNLESRIEELENKELENKE